MGTLMLNISMPFQIICVQCNKEMKPNKGSKGIPTCPQCGFKAKVIVQQKPIAPGMPDLKLAKQPTFKRPTPLA